MTTIEQWKSRAFIGTLAFISITVNATYARIQHRYQNGSDFVQRIQQEAQPAPIIPPPVTPVVQYPPAPQPMMVSYAPASEPPPPLLPVVQDALARSEIHIVAKPYTPHRADEEKLLRKEERKEEREEKKEAREEAMTNNPATLKSNVVEIAKAPDSKEAKREEREERKRSAEMTPNYSDPQLSKHLKESQDNEHASAYPESQTIPDKDKKETGNHDEELKKAVEAKTITPPVEIKPAKAPVPPTSGPSIWHRIVRGIQTGGQSGSEYEKPTSQPSRNPQRSYGQTNYSNTYPPPNRGGNQTHSHAKH